MPSIVLPLGSLALLVAVLVANLQIPQMAWVVSIALTTGMFAFAFLLAGVFLHLHRRQDESATVLETTESQLVQIEDNIQEIFWMIDAETKQVLRVNQAYQTITGRSCQSLIRNPSSFREIIHPEDRTEVLSRLDEGVRKGKCGAKRLFRMNDLKLYTVSTSVHARGYANGGEYTVQRDHPRSPVPQTKS